jgi:hypothetical protein
MPYVYSEVILLGGRGAALAASAVNLAAAIGALGLDRAVRPRATAHRAPEPIRLAGEARVALVLYALAGGSPWATKWSSPRPSCSS